MDRGWAGFTRTPAGHAAILGFFGSMVVTFGGFGAGATRIDDPVLDTLRLSWLRYGHGNLISTILVWVGIAMLVVGWVRLGREALAERVATRELAAVAWAWVLPLLLAVPMFSRDIYSYLAQGTLLRLGYDPYEVGPVANPGVLLDNVSGIWTTTTAPYGPAFLLLAAGVTAITGSSIIAGAVLLRIVMLPGLAMMIWAIPKLAHHLGGRAAVGVWIGVLNPLVLVHLVGGGHNEILMVGFMVAGLALALEQHPFIGIGVVAVGVAVKATAGAALPFIVWIAMAQRRRATGAPEGEPDFPARQWWKLFARTAGGGIGVFAAVLAAISTAAGVGIGWIVALTGSAKIINWLSVPTMLAHLVRMSIFWFSNVQLTQILTFTRVLSGLALVGIILWAWWRGRRTEYDAVRGVLIVLVAICLLSPAALPWYYSWPLAVAAGFPLSKRTLTALVGFSVWMLAAFNPGGTIGLYDPLHVVVSIAVGVLAAWSLTTVDPLRLRKPAPTPAPASS